MSLDDRIKNDYVQAMKDKDTPKSSALNYLRAMIKQVKVDKRLETLEDNEVIAVIKKQIKQRLDSIEQFEKGSRADLVAKEKYEVDLMRVYLPAEMSTDELSEIIAAVVKDTGATSMKDMGSVMKAVREKVGGKADGKLVSDLVREQLSAL